MQMIRKSIRLIDLKDGEIRVRILPIVVCSLSLAVFRFYRRRLGGEYNRTASSQRRSEALALAFQSEEYPRQASGVAKTPFSVPRYDFETKQSDEIIEAFTLFDIVLRFQAVRLNMMYHKGATSLNPTSCVHDVRTLRSHSAYSSGIPKGEFCASDRPHHPSTETCRGMHVWCYCRHLREASSIYTMVWWARIPRRVCLCWISRWGWLDWRGTRIFHVELELFLE